MCADVHELDEAQRVTALAEERRHRDDLILVDAALDDRVHLHRQARRRGGVDAFEHALDREVDVVQGTERRVVERVEADGDAIEPGVRERLRLRREQRRVGRQRQFDLELCELGDQALEVAADERLAARDPQLAGAERDERARDARDLFERQELAPVEETMVAPVDLLRHAVGAAEVAAVGDRDAQVPERPAKCVVRVHVGNRSSYEVQRVKGLTWTKIASKARSRKPKAS